ncbi:hypothetical protein GKZ68_13440 [Hymenobacter sp. BRD128]|uniref:hypothetical protein n=1 Tax=Hymenobacter sp. BRD128 TaxID=2675878 RepID=UPI001566C60B|nr:hypothetical protein [Hymenobacter sp. BRD128]QKG57535.1 hypothetical protein GKZ68_13440 [Hymenobacter sp. BRD128]
MKSLLSVFGEALLASVAYAQKIAPTQVPAAAQATFGAKFPAVKTVTWEKEGANFEAGFRLNGKTMSAVITPTGVIQEIETAMPATQLPAAVRATLARDYQACTGAEAASITKANGTTVYEAAVAKGSTKQDVLFTADGRLVAY